MCTIVFASRVFDDFHTVICGNRDEEYSRGFHPPETREVSGTRMLAPRDEKKGGTWIGFNEEGVAAALSNLPEVTDSSDCREPRSRGLLCRDILGCSTVREAREVVEGIDDLYRGFNLVVAGKKGCFVAVYDGELEVRKARWGVVTNSEFTEPDQKTRRVSKMTPNPEKHEAREWIKKVKEILRSHDPEVCVHGENKGTTSSSMIAVSSNADESVYFFADGRACESSYREIKVGGGVRFRLTVCEVYLSRS